MQTIRPLYDFPTMGNSSGLKHQENDNKQHRLKKFRLKG
jgi:hypothetical protein